MVPKAFLDILPGIFWSDSFAFLNASQILLTSLPTHLHFCFLEKQLQQRNKLKAKEPNKTSKKYLKM